jgi:4-amino-4-deoxy-L-arabinose transferase
MRLMLLLVFVAVFLALYVFPLGVRPLVVPDETRYAEIPREMLASGDWIVPHLNGLRYFEKPPLGYWLNAGAIWLFGENAFAVRFPAAVATGLTAALLFVWARRFTGEAATPWLATAIFLLSFEVVVIGVFCVLDSVLSLFVTGAILGLHGAYEQQTRCARSILLVLAGAACGLAFLTKGFLALAVPVIVIVPFAFWQGRLRICLRTAWVPLVTAILVALPWAVAIHLREPDFWRYFFWVEHIERFTSPRGGQHPAPFWFYVPILLAGAMPWTPLVGSVVQGVRHTNRNQPMVRLALCWFVLPLLLFSASSGKLGTYILPCFPPLAFLIAVGLLRCLGEGDTKGFVVGAWALMLGAGSLLLTLIVALSTMPEMYDRVAGWEWGIAAAGLVLWVVFCRAAIVQPRVQAKLGLYCAGPVLFMFSWHFICAAALSPEKAPGAFLLSHAAAVPGKSTFVAENGFVGAICWFCRRDDVLVIGRPGEYAYGLSYEGAQSRALDVGQVKDLILGQARTEPVLLVLGAKYHAECEEQLPKPCREERREGLVWAEYSPPAQTGVSEAAQ